MSETGNMYKDILDGMANGIAVVDMNCDVLYVNNSLELQLNTHNGNKCYEYLNNNSTICSFCKNSEILRGRIVDWEWNCQKNNKVYRIVDTPIIDNNGSISKVKVFHDITEMKRCENELRLENMFIKSIINSLNSIVLVLSGEGKIITVNQYMEEITGYQLKDIRGMSYHEIFIPEGKREEIIETSIKTINDITNNNYINPITCKDGKVIIIEWDYNTLKDDDGDITGLVLLGQNISKRLSQEKKLKTKVEQLNNMNNMLKAMVRRENDTVKQKEQLLIQQSKMASMGEMLSLIAHQWKQPLNAISLTAQDIVDAFTYKELDDKYLRNNIDTIQGQINFMSRTVDDFNDFLKPSCNKVPFDLNKVIVETFKIISPRLKHSNISYSLKCNICNKEFNTLNLLSLEYITQCECISIIGYPNEFAHILINLINNSAEAIVDSIDKGLMDKLSGEITLDILEENGNIIISILDNGGGIPQNIIGDIFNLYFTTKEKGTGIGLYMAKMIIEKHMDGKLYCKNINGGTMFSIKLKINDNHSQK